MPKFDIWKHSDTRWIVVDSTGVIYSVTESKNGTLSVCDRGSDTREPTASQVKAIVNKFERVIRKSLGPDGSYLHGTLCGLESD